MEADKARAGGTIDQRVTRLEVQFDEHRGALTEWRQQIGTDLADIKSKLNQLVDRDTQRNAVMSTLATLWRVVVVPFLALIVAAVGFVLRPIIETFFHRP